MHTTKIATCCYCGTRAALVFDKTLHELTCSACGAPLHNMKSLPERTGKNARISPSVQQSATIRHEYTPEYAKKFSKRRKKKKKFSKFNRKIMGKIWDAVEDIFD